MSPAPADAKPPDEPALRVRGLSKTYGRRGRRVEALRGVDLSVRRGEIFGLLGPNGAGKTTLVKCVLTICAPDGGEAHLLGEPAASKDVLARVGYLPEGHQFPFYLTAFEVLDHFAALAGAPRAERRRRADELLGRLGLRDARDRRVDKLSKGMAQRLGIANALAADPDVVLLDEPTDGLDPMGRREVRDLLLELRAAGKSVLLNSHLLGEVEQVCDRVAILIDGKVARTGSVAELAPPAVRYWLDADDIGRLEQAVRPLAAGVSRPTGGHPGLLVDLAGKEQVVGLIDAVRAAGVALYAVSPMRRSLEDVFVKLVQEQAAGREGRP